MIFFPPCPRFPMEERKQSNFIMSPCLTMKRWKLRRAEERKSGKRLKEKMSPCLRQNPTSETFEVLQDAPRRGKIRGQAGVRQVKKDNLFNVAFMMV